MRLAISNIAWAPDEEIKVFELLKRYGVEGIEVAPTVIYPNWAGFTPEAGKAYRGYLESHGFVAPALQSILYGRPELSIFDPSCRDAFCSHIEAVAEFAGALGAKVLVFGSPKNRRRGQLSMEQAFEQAIPLVREMGEICAAHDCCIGWEHNPVEYQCDFVNNLADVCEFVERVDHPGVRVHGDAGGLQFCGDPWPIDRFAAADYAHFHASAPFLEPIGDQEFDYAALIAALKASGYDEWLSIEMKRASEDPLTAIKASVRRLRELLV